MPSVKREFILDYDYLHLGLCLEELFSDHKS